VSQADYGPGLQWLVKYFYWGDYSLSSESLIACWGLNHVHVRSHGPRGGIQGQWHQISICHVSFWYHKNKNIAPWNVLIPQKLQTSLRDCSCTILWSDLHRNNHIPRHHEKFVRSAFSSRLSFYASQMTLNHRAAPCFFPAHLIRMVETGQEAPSFHKIFLRFWKF